MGNNDLTKFPDSGLIKTNTVSQARAKSYKISKVSEHNFSQYVRTVKAYALAGMTFQDIANAGDLLGDEVERKDADAPFKQNLNNKIGEIAENENQILAWQDRGEKASLTPQLASPQGSGREIVVASQDLVISDSDRGQTIEVLEGIKVIKEAAPRLPDPGSESLPENNPFLKIRPEE